MKNAREYRGQVDFGIITVRYDEFEAAFHNRFPIIDTAMGVRRYAISRVQARNGLEYLVALSRCPDQGHGPAQELAEDIIDDIDPQWLVVIGIGGAVPADEFTLGDVVVATVVLDFSLQAATQGKPPSFDLRGGEVYPDVAALVAHLPAMQKALTGWNTKRSIRIPLPKLNIPAVDSDLLYGEVAWREKVVESLRRHFPTNKEPRLRRLWTGPIGTSNTLVKDTELITALLTGARGIVAVEMETGGVRRAARRAGRNYPVLTIRGVSDVIGLKRNPDWTTFACHSVAAFTYALIRTGEVIATRGRRAGRPAVPDVRDPQPGHARLSAKLRELENNTSLVLTQFQESKLAIPYPERRADEDIRNILISLQPSQPAFLTVIGEAGIGKSTLLFRLVEWCRDDDRYFPVWLDWDLFSQNGETLSQFFDCPPKELGFRLQQLADLAQKRLVLFIDALDIILPHTNAAKLVSQLNKLASNAILICSSRPTEYRRLRDDVVLTAREIALTELSPEHVQHILHQAEESGQYQVRARDIDPKLIEMCQNPFMLYLLLESSKTNTVPYAANPTRTWVLQRYWAARVEQVRPWAFESAQFEGMSKDEVGLAKADLAYRMVLMMLEAQTYRLPLASLEGILEQLTNRSSINRSIYQELVAEGVVREIKETGGKTREASFLHDSFADFVMCKQILASHDWESEVQTVLRRIGSPFYVPIAVRLVRQARDIRQGGTEDRIRYLEIEDKIYDIMVKFLEEKRRNQSSMNRAWGVTYALRDLVSDWVERLCGSLREHCPQEAASSIAAVLDKVRHPLVVPTLVEGMNSYRLTKRFIDGLGASADQAAVEPLLNLLEGILDNRDERQYDVLESIARALGKIGDKRALPLLMKLETDDIVPLAARRAARETLWVMTNRAEYSEPLPFTDEETIEGLRIRDRSDPDLYSDWKMVKRTAERITSEAKEGRPVSPTVEQALVNALDHEHEDAQRAVVQALTIISAGSAINSLTTKVINPETPDAIRKEIVESLAHIASQTTTELQFSTNIHEVLRNVARKDPNPQVRQAVSDALRRVNF